MTRLMLLIAGLIVAIPTLVRPAAALESDAVHSARATATLVTETDAIQPNQPFRAALRLRMANGWHTYWKNPGDAGVAPELTVDPPAIASGIDWPRPARVAEGPVMTYAYTNEVLLPVTVTMQPGTLTAHAQWLVCKDICVPEEGTFTLQMRQGTPAPSAQAPLFATHDRAVPRPSPWQATIAADGTLFVQGPELTPATVTDAWFIPDEPGRIQDDAAQPLSVRNGGFTLALKRAANAPANQPLSGLLSVRDRAGEQADVTITAIPGTAPGPAIPPLPRVLAFAFLGGLILNLMPCVFPILAMKAVSLSRGASHEAAHRRHMHALSYAAGVLVMFVGLAAALLLARAAGAAVGWGFQFASPIFVAAMTWLLLAVGLNLSGVFQIGGAGIAGSGNHLAHRHDLLGSFFTGLLAVLVATPCTAPFMGVAIAAGLAAPALVTVLVFSMLGIGLAAPYVLLASLPAAARLLPRPGHWMDLLKQALAFPMYGGAAWLLWVVSQETGSTGVLITGAGAVLIGFAAWAFGASQASAYRSARSWVRRLGQAGAVLAMLAAGATLPAISSATPQSGSQLSSGTEPFSPERLAALRAQGRPVFVDMTAVWCVTCLVIERVAISTDAVRQAFAADDVVYMKGDWTRQDPEITSFLQQNGRDGVPLYVFYPSGGGNPVVLPQILTESAVLGVLRTS